MSTATSAPTVESCMEEVRVAYGRLRAAADRAEQLRVPHLRRLREQYDEWLQEEAGRWNLRPANLLQCALDGWDAPAWQAYEPPDAAGPVFAAARLGAYVEPVAEPLGELGALLPILGHQNVILSGPPAAGRATLQTLALRLLLTSPPGQLRLALVDPVTAGAALAAFLKLPSALRGERIAIRPEEIDQLLRAVEDHIAEVNQQRLGNVYDTVEAYNAVPGSIRIPYRLLLVADFPAGFDERSFQRLLTVLRNGPRAGVHVLLHLDPAQPVGRCVDLAALPSLAQQLDLSQAQLRLPAADLAEGLLVRPDALPPAARVNGWLEALARAADQSSSTLPFQRLAIPADQRWRGDSTDGLVVPVGVTGQGEVWRLAMGETGKTNHHGLVVGMPGSGKSNLLHVLICQLTQRYAPEQLELYLLDFREGVGFQPYRALPHVRALALESEREFALSILRHLQAAMQERGQLYKPLGVDQYFDYRRQSGAALPRKFLIMDEFQVLFRDDDRLAQEAATLLEDLVKRGRGFGINLLLCSQSLGISGRSGAQIYNMMGLRVALQCAAQDSVAVLGTEAAARLEQPGDALVQGEDGVHRVASLPVDERRAALGVVAALAAGGSYPAPVTFESQSPALLGGNGPLGQLLSAPDWPAPAAACRFWLGEPIAMAGPVEGRFERYPRMNLLVAGGTDLEAYGLMAAVLLSVAAQRAPDAVSFVLADFARPDSPAHGLFGGLTEQLPHTVHSFGAREAGGLPAELTAELEARLGGDARPDLFVLIAGLHRWRELRSSDTYSPTDAGRALARLADEGPDLGIHLLLWTDSTDTLGRLRRGALDSFDLRAVLRVDERSSQDLLGTNAAARLADNRAFYRNEDDELGKMDKLKPYAFPTAADVAGMVVGLRGRGAG